VLLASLLKRHTGGGAGDCDVEGKRFVGILIGTGLTASLLTGAVAAPKHEERDRRGKTPIVVGHRGASGYRPEHTLEAYQLAIDMGAQFIEPDLVSTKDGILVARHENEISGTTDVEDHPEFADRKRTKTVDGVRMTGWFTEDFTLEELKTLRAEERIPRTRAESQVFDGLYEVPALQEIIDLAKREGVGIYPETKHPTYFDSIGLSLEEPLVQTLEANGLDSKDDRVFIQSFEVSNLRELDRMTDVRLVQLVNSTGQPYDFTATGHRRTYADLIEDEKALEEVAEYADGLGANKDLIVPRDSENRLLEPTDLVERAHNEGLFVHAWTFRDENAFLPTEFRAGDPSHTLYAATREDAPSEYELFFSTGLDGLFTDNPDTAVSVAEGSSTAVKNP
jgi:glycerophosphoryl diester phosphodiesterase